MDIDDGEGDDLIDEGEGGGGKEEGMEIAPSAIPKHLKEDPDVSRPSLAQLFNTRIKTCFSDHLYRKTTLFSPLKPVLKEPVHKDHLPIKITFYVSPEKSLYTGFTVLALLRYTPFMNSTEC